MHRAGTGVVYWVAMLATILIATAVAALVIAALLVAVWIGSRNQ